MYNELISFTFDAEEWTLDGNTIDFKQLAYPDCLSEITYGHLTLTDEKNASKFVIINDVELGYLAITLSFQAQQLTQGDITKASVASLHQHFDLLLTVGKDKVCTLCIIDEPEKNISMHLDTLNDQLRNFRNTIWVDMYNHYPQISEIEDYANMEADFIS